MDRSIDFYSKSRKLYSGNDGRESQRDTKQLISKLQLILSPKSGFDLGELEGANPVRAHSPGLLTDLNF